MVLFTIIKAIELGKEVVKYGAFVIIVYFTYLSILSLAGKETSAIFVFQYLTSVKDGNISWKIVTALTTFWAFLERKLKKDSIKHFKEHIIELEKKLDPNRSSSNLTKEGNTNPGDKL